jgi:FkbM family methyltransferase
MGYEMEVQKAVQALDFTHFVDIGAAFGFYSHWLSATGKTCVAVEVDEFRWACLQRTSGNFEKIRAIIGKDPVYRGLNLYSMGDSRGNGHQLEYDEPKLRLSDLVERYNLPESTLWKLDIEGGEAGLFHSEPEIFERYQWLIELHHFAMEPSQFRQLFSHRPIREVAMYEHRSIWIIG